jgi:hypothetical protein
MPNAREILCARLRGMSLNKPDFVAIGLTADTNNQGVAHARENSRTLVALALVLCRSAQSIVGGLKGEN